MYQCTLFDVGGVEIHNIEYCTKDQSNVKDVEDRSNTPKGCNAVCHGFVSAGDALGRECPATPMLSFLAGRSGCK